MSVIESPSRRPLVRSALALALGGVLVAAAAAPTWAAVPTVDAVTDSETTIAVDNATAASGNTATVATTATGTNTWTATVDYTVTAPEGEPTPLYINAVIDPDLDNAGFYAVLGNIADADWRPSDGAASSTRESGPSAWFNEDGGVTQLGSTIDDQYVYAPGEPVSNSFTVDISYDPTAAEYTITGAAIGPDGETQSYELVSSEPVYQLWTLGALGTGSSTPQLEQVVNVEFAL